MSERFGFSIEFDAPFGPETLRLAFEAARDSVVRDWVEYRDEFSFAEPPSPVDVEAWVKLALAGPEEGSLLTAVPLTFSFSPRSNRVALLWVDKWRDSALRLWLGVDSRIIHESDHDRESWRKQVDPDFIPPDPNRRWRWDEERLDLEWIGPEPLDAGAVNLACLRRLFESLRVALPLWEARIDEPLLDVQVR